MLKKIVYTTSLLIILTLSGCQIQPKYGTSLAYTAIERGGGYKIYKGDWGDLAYTVTTSGGGGYKIYKGDWGDLAYTAIERGGDIRYIEEIWKAWFTLLSLGEGEDIKYIFNSSVFRNYLIFAFSCSRCLVVAPNMELMAELARSEKIKRKQKNHRAFPLWFF